MNCRVMWQCELWKEFTVGATATCGEIVPLWDGLFWAQTVPVHKYIVFKLSDCSTSSERGRSYHTIWCGSGVFFLLCWPEVGRYLKRWKDLVTDRRHPVLLVEYSVLLDRSI